MQNLSTNGSSYSSHPNGTGSSSSLFPSLSFYPRFLMVVYRSAVKSRRNSYDLENWQQSSITVMRALESVGVEFDVQGLEHIEAVDGPVLFIGNHLSVMETVVLPTWVLPYKPFTYVIKQSLLEVPVFKHVMRHLDPIAVTRTNPRQDLKTVLEQGVDRLSRNLSVVIFPQTTRTAFNPEQFSTIGVKLARKAGVPIVPLALLTDAWENGSISKDFGRIVPSRKVHFAFGEPLSVEGKGSDEHQKIISFIESHLALWQKERA
jgi:1-acyl-sn-glycerol-3-phosphate acyltransferase